jgi:hypothetical protein
MADFIAQPNRYILVHGDKPDAPDCPYGNKYQWIGFDNLTNEYVRFTKSVFKLLIKKQAN